MLYNIFRRLKFSRIINKKDNSFFIASRNTLLQSEKGAVVNLRGNTLVGFPLPPHNAIVPTMSRTVISLGHNSQLIIDGRLFIAPGCMIKVGDNAILHFHGDNSIAHNSTILCNNHIVIGKRSAISWNVTIIDDDLHRFYDINGNKIDKNLKQLIIQDNVGIQMNVVIPAGGFIGKNSIIAANTVIREDIPENTLVFSESKLVKKFGYTTGFCKYENKRS